MHKGQRVSFTPSKIKFGKQAPATREGKVVCLLPKGRVLIASNGRTFSKNQKEVTELKP